jgi:hypothetical protein
MKPANYRLRIRFPGSTSRNYITRVDGRVSYLSADETPLALSNLVSSEAAETRFALEDSFDGTLAAGQLRLVLAKIWVNNPPGQPKVEVLP